MAIAATEASGAARAAAAKQAARQEAAQTAAQTAADRGAGPAPRRKTDANGNATFRGETRSPRGPRSVRWAWSGNRRVLTAQFVLCLVVVGLGALTSGEDDKDDVVVKAMLKSSALCLVFFLLALMMAGGKGSQRTATAFGSLITLAYVVTSPDVHTVVKWIGKFFATEHKPSTEKQAEQPEQKDALVDTGDL